MLNKTIGICIVVIFGNAIGMKVSTHYADLAAVAGDRLASSVSVGATVSSASVR